MSPIRLTLRSFILGLLYSIYILAMATLIGEVFLRYAFTPEALKTRIQSNRLAKDPDQIQESLFELSEMKFRSNSTGKILHQEYNVSASHDRFGFRNPCFNFNKPVSEIILGDSFVYGVGLNDFDTLGCHLKKEKPDINVYTMGVPGANPVNYLQILEKNKKSTERLIGGKKRISVMIFVGNDYESLISLGDGAKTKTSSRQNIIHNTLESINFYFVKSKWLSESYFFQALKIAYIRIFKPNETKNYFINYAGSTFYKAGTALDTSIIVSSINKIKEKIEAVGYAFDSFYLIPDPADVSESRLSRDSMLGQFTPGEIDVNHKFNSLINACNQAQLSCIDFRPLLSETDYYIQDNHLRVSGIKKISKEIAHKNLIKQK